MVQASGSETGAGSGGDAGGSENRTGAGVPTDRNSDGRNADADVNTASPSVAECRGGGDSGDRADIAPATDATAADKPGVSSESPPSSLSAIAVRGKDPPASAPPRPSTGTVSAMERMEAAAATATAATTVVVESPRGSRGSDSERERAADAIKKTCSDASVGVRSLGRDGGRARGDAGDGSDDGPGNAATAEKVGDEAAGHNSESRSSFDKRAEEHLSCKYTKQELMARHWGMSLLQMKRVKALLRMGVCEEDLVIADRLLKMGRDLSNDTPLTKEEQLLGYTAHQRQRLKALHILGLTEESFDRCRAVMLSSLGPSAFGYSTDETAESAVRAEAEQSWTPGDKFRRRGPGNYGGGGGRGGGGPLKVPIFNPGRGNGISRLFPAFDGGSRGSGDGGIRSVGERLKQHVRRVSDSDMGSYLPNIKAANRKPRGGGGGSSVVVELGAVKDSPLTSRRIHSAKTDPG